MFVEGIAVQIMGPEDELGGMGGEASELGGPAPAAELGGEAAAAGAGAGGSEDSGNSAGGSGDGPTSGGGEAAAEIGTEAAELGGAAAAKPEAPKEEAKKEEAKKEEVKKEEDKEEAKEEKDGEIPAELAARLGIKDDKEEERVVLPAYWDSFPSTPYKTKGPLGPANGDSQSLISEKINNSVMNIDMAFYNMDTGSVEFGI